MTTIPTDRHLTAAELRALPIGSQYWPQSYVGYLKRTRGDWTRVDSGRDRFTSQDIAAMYQ